MKFTFVCFHIFKLVKYFPQSKIKKIVSNSIMKRYIFFVCTYSVYLLTYSDIKIQFPTMLSTLIKMILTLFSDFINKKLKICLCNKVSNFVMLCKTIIFTFNWHAKFR